MKIRISLFWKLVIAAALVNILWGYLTKGSLAFFIFLDDWLRISEVVSPVLMWSLFGAMAGACCGAVIACRKYKLPKRSFLVPLAAFAVVLIFLLMI